MNETFIQKLFDVFSIRNKQNNQTEIKKFLIPQTLRSRVLMRCKDVFPDRLFKTFLEEINKFLLYKLGSITLTEHEDIYFERSEETIDYLGKCSGEDFLDFIEYIFRVDSFNHLKLNRFEFVKELNSFLEMDDLPYHITDFVTKKREMKISGKIIPFTETISGPKVIMKESQLVHSQIIAPALQFLKHPDYLNANNEFLEALEDYRKDDYKDCLTKCCSSFESVMKIICQNKGWTYEQKNTAKPLVDIIIKNTDLEPFFEQTLIIVAILRNKLSSVHGDGVITKEISPQIAEYAINMTASSMLMLLKQSGEL